MKKTMGALFMVIGLTVGLTACQTSGPTESQSQTVTFSETEGATASFSAETDAQSQTSDGQTDAQNGDSMSVAIKDNGDDTVTFTDSCGRAVVLPKNLTQVAPSGASAQMIIYTLAPDVMVGWSSNPTSAQQKYFDEKYYNLPEFGQFYGKNVSLNMEALIAAKPQVIIDMGDMKDGHGADMDAIQEQTGIPTIFIEANLDTFSQAYRTLGALLNMQTQAETLASYIDETIAMAEERSAKIADEDRLTVMFASGDTGLEVNAAGSIHSAVIDIVGAKNAIVVDEISNKSGGNTINMETVLLAQPDVILFSQGGPYETVSEDENWGGVTAISQGRYYGIPNGPYDWMTQPPAVNRIIGIRWLGNLLYPDLYDEDMIEEAKTFYQLFWHYDLSDEEARALMAHSTYKIAE